MANRYEGRAGTGLLLTSARRSGTSAVNNEPLRRHHPVAKPGAKRPTTVGPRTTTKFGVRITSNRFSTASQPRRARAVPRMRNEPHRKGGARLCRSERWPGAGSNRRPSAFQADARTN